MKNSRIDISGGQKLTRNVLRDVGRVWMIDESTWGKCNWGKANKKGELSSKIQGSTRAPSKLIKGGRSIHLIGPNRHWSDKRWAMENALEMLLQ